MTKIYYLSGRGGSLFTARELAQLLNAGTPVPMTGRKRPGRQLPEPADTVGFVFPVIDFGVPVSVRQYLAAFQGTAPRYVFAVAMNMGMPCATLAQFGTLLSRRGMHLDAGFSIERKTRPADSEPGLMTRIQEIAAVVASSGTGIERPGTVTDRLVLTGICNALARACTGGEDRKFRVNGQCTGCGTCVRVCPAGNITLHNGRPEWHHFCDQCGACFTWCPQEAVSGTCLAARARRPEPGITAADMMIQEGGIQ